MLDYRARLDMLKKLITLYNQQHPFIWLVLAVCSIWLISRCFVEGFKGGSGAGKPIYVTRVTKPEDISRGLMFRTEPLGQNVGLLFDKGSWSDTGFWMKNTLIPLDIIFLDEEYQVIDVLRDMVPGDLTVRSINKSWRYAVEVNAGGYPDITIGGGINIVG